MGIARSVTELIGKTPLLQLGRVVDSALATVLLKLENFNPMSSVKDRIAYAMIRSAEARGQLRPGGFIVEPTSGNAGISLAYIGAALGYQVLLTMPDTFSIERRKLLGALGAQLVLTPGALGMRGAVAKAEEIVAGRPGSFMPSQFTNPANVEAHYTTTGPEIWDDCEGRVDVLVAGVGTGGTLTGTGRFLREKNPGLKIVAVEPEASPVLSGGAPGPHKIQGIGSGFVPENFDRSLVDEIVKVGHENAGEMSRRLAKEEGVLLGISAGANVWAALEIARRPESRGKTIVTIGCDTGERYLSTWLFEE